MLEIIMLDARKGDSFVIRHDDNGDIFTGLIDGGTPDRFATAVEPALTDLGIAPGQIGLDWLAVSHVDDDHIGGINDAVAAGFRSAAYYFNTPAVFPTVDVTPATVHQDPAKQIEQTYAQLLGRVAAGVAPASIGQGQTLLDHIVTTGAHRLNPPDNARLLTGATVDVEGLTLVVVAPSEDRLKKLLDEWADEFPAGTVIPASSETMDDSVSNLSTLAFLMRHPSGTALFTGDALEDDLLAGLDDIDFFDVPPGADPPGVDVLKLPHHGSNSAANEGKLAAGIPGLIERVPAKHYIVSADGQNTNPTHSTLDRIVAANLTTPVTVWLPSAPRDDGTVSAPVYAAAVKHLHDAIAAAGAPITVEQKLAAGPPLTLTLP